LTYLKKIPSYDEEKIMKHISALFAALLITGLIGLGTLAIGVNALVNRNTVAIQNSPADAAALAPAASSPDTQQLQQLVNQYQAELDQANFQIQQYQSLLVALQQRGLIVIGQDGNVYIPSNTQ